MRILVATNNKNKLAEFQRMLNLPGVQFLTPEEAGLPADFDVEETGLTFEENAELKATQYARAANLPAMADDSGLVVDALNGEPGIYSKRYAGENATDPQRIALLLSKIADVPDEKRTGRFVAAIALANPDGRIVVTCRGISEGTIAWEPRGSNGFGYDPIFLPAGFHGRTFAELNDEEKDAISHRGNAFRLIRPDIETYVEHAGK
ncbi:MAG TPA: RdgB/HAM1 family non-canonical purine NTP pyrophosphatase [Chloroflexia bacterium]|nr:RdgB/HAM1 family non-canonical purine NTP pyrophosphatase [Chloroflexia bacterium]